MTDWVKNIQEALKLLALFGVLALIIWTMPDQGIMIPPAH